MAISLANGTTVVFAGSGFNMKITSFDGPHQTRASIDTTNLDTTGARTKIPHTLVDNETFSIEGHHDGTIAPPIDQPAETITTQIGGAGSGFATGESFSAFMTDYNKTGNEGELVTFTAELTITGAVTFDTTPAA